MHAETGLIVPFRLPAMTASFAIRIDDCAVSFEASNARADAERTAFDVHR